MKQIIQFILENKETLIWVLGVVYEVLMRLVPTVADWSIINKIIRVIEFFFPNRTSRFSPKVNDSDRQKVINSILGKQKVHLILKGK